MDSTKVSSDLIHQYIINDPLHHLFDAVDSISVQGYDDERRVIYWNIGSELLYGYTKEEALGRKIEDLIIPKHMSDVVIDAHADWVKKGIEIPASEITLSDKNGNNINVFSSHVMFTNQYNKKQMYCIDVDLTDVRDAQAQALFKQHMLEAVFKATPDLFFLMDENGTIIDYHASNTKNLYVSPSEFVGSAMVDILPKHVAITFKKNILIALKQQGMSSFEYELTLPHGLVHFEARINHLKEHKQVVTVVRDITEQHKSAEIIRQQAYFDTLTSLPNRFLSLDRLSQMLNESERNNAQTAIFFLDIDDFKKVNDSLGHEIGDKLLIQSAKRLSEVIRKEDTVGRLGGDEFIVLSRKVTKEQDASFIAENLLKAFRDPFKIDDRELVITLSIGIAIYPENGHSASELLRNADTAMYQAKAIGRNAYSFYTKEMNVIMTRRFEIEEQMHGALDRNEFEVYYQPQINVKDGRIMGAEALLRWHNTYLGNVTPDEFIPIAEQTGLIISIGQFVIVQATNLLKHWQDSHQHRYTMAINLSPRQFRDNTLTSFIKSTLCDANVAARDLEIEITEGVLMDGQSFIIEALSELHELGVQLSMDDFGTGYSSLNYLRKYSFDVLKIDKSFIAAITLNKTDLGLVKAIIAMSHSLGLTIIAEGVETKEQFSLLKSLGCHVVQGYYFSRPLPANTLIQFSENYRAEKTKN